MKNLKIGTRLGLGFLVMMLLMAFISATGLLRLESVGNATQEMVEGSLVKERLISQWFSELMANNVRTIAMVKSMDSDSEAYFKKGIGESSARIGAIQKKVEALISSPEEKKLLAQVADTRKEALDALGAIGKLKAADQWIEATKVADTRFAAALANYEKLLGELAELQRQQIDGAAKGIAQDHGDGRRVLITLSLIALVVAGLSAWRLTIGITRPLGDAVKVAETVAAGDLSARIEVRTQDETGQLFHALRQMNESLAKVVGEVRTGTDNIATASGQIASGNQDLSSRTEEQASSLEQTAASMEELTSTVKQNADN
ncbi:methyl-accepting chemotaxis protein, partial [Variovorax sp. LARHSF232]